MTLAIVVYVPDGIVFASDSRQSLTLETTNPDGSEGIKVETVNSDNVYKTILIEKETRENGSWQIGISTYGQDMLGKVSTASHLTKFSEEKLDDKETVGSVAQKLMEYFSAKFPGAKTGFHVAGYTIEDSISTPHVYTCKIEHKLVKRMNIGQDKNIIYGASWAGQIDILSSILNPSFIQESGGNFREIKKKQIIWDAMPLQDAIDFAVYAMRTTIDTIRFQARPKNVGGPIDVLIITPESGATWIQRKEFHGYERK